MIFNKPQRKVNKVYIHCSASDVKAHDNIEAIREWHIQDNKWSDVGYHYFIRKDGTIEEGRGLEIIPSAQKGHNTGSIAICLSGLDIDLFRQKQLESLVNLCKEINKVYSKITFHGHCEVSNKECPVFDYKNILNLDDEGYILTEPKKKMAFPLLLLATPFIKPFIKKLAVKGWDKLKGKVLDKAKETVISKILEKTGINLGDDLSDQEKQNKIEEAMNNLSPEQLLELKKEIIESESELLKAELENQTEQMAIVNRTMKAELKADDPWQRRWRPVNGFCFAFTLSILLISFVGLGFFSVYTGDSNMVEMISKLIFSFSPLIGVWSAVLGVSSYTRGKEKLEKIKRL